jgi:hypothetical protein
MPPLKPSGKPTAKEMADHILRVAQGVDILYRIDRVIDRDEARRFLNNTVFDGDLYVPDDFVPPGLNYDDEKEGAMPEETPYLNPDEQESHVD